MNRSIKHMMFFTLAAILLLAACAPAPAPTQDPAQIQQQVQESVSLTLAAKEAESAAQQVQAVPSNTPLPTQTEAVPPAATLDIPTATPFVIVPPTLAPSGGGGGTTIKPEYACDVIHQRPYDDTDYKPNVPFDIKWTIVNTGTKTWPAGLDLKYDSGDEMTAPSTGPIELPEMAPGDQFDVTLDAITPAKEGTRVMVWVVEGGICYPYVRIIVEK